MNVDRLSVDKLHVHPSSKDSFCVSLDGIDPVDFVGCADEELLYGILDACSNESWFDEWLEEVGVV